MANLACIGSRKVNGVAEVRLRSYAVLRGACGWWADEFVMQLHSELVRQTIMKDFVDFYGVSKCVCFWLGLVEPAS